MPDKWEYPWYAAWDLVFHTLPLQARDRLRCLWNDLQDASRLHIPFFEFLRSRAERA
jgi:hypothetical protein